MTKLTFNRKCSQSVWSGRSILYELTSNVYSKIDIKTKLQSVLWDVSQVHKIKPIVRFWGKTDRENLWLKTWQWLNWQACICVEAYGTNKHFRSESQESNQGHLKDTVFDNSTILTKTMRATGPRNPKSAPLSNDSQHLVWEI